MHYIGIVFVPLSVLVAGILLLQHTNRPQLKRVGTCVALIGGALTFVAVWFTLTYPAPQRLDKGEYLLFSIPPDQVDAVVLEPKFDDGASNLDLVRSRITITAQNEVRRIINALHTAVRTSPNHPGTRWTCNLVIKSKEDSVSVEINDTASNDNGVLIYWWSGRGQGWVIGKYRCDDLGPILEHLSKAHNTQTETAGSAIAP
jgi:hypothetical protein